MQNQVGVCPHCGAPIYQESPWHGITPPPSIKTCTCVPNKTWTQQAPLPPPPQNFPKTEIGETAFDKLTKAMKDNNLIPESLADKVDRLENAVEDLTKAVTALVDEKKKCNCKKKKPKTKTILKEEK
jgi:hypothetical protein